MQVVDYADGHKDFNEVDRNLCLRMNIKVKASIHQYRRTLKEDARDVPQAERYPDRPAVGDNVDLTGAKLFLESQARALDFAALVERHWPDQMVQYGDERRRIVGHAVLRKLLLTLQQLFALWKRKAFLTVEQVGQHRASIQSLSQCWQALGWKPTLWVHWVCAHSHFFVARYRSMAVFSSIPTEHRHQRYKRDLRHAFMGWRLQRPLLSVGWLCRAVELDALDLGLHYFRVTDRNVQNKVMLAPRKGRKRKREQ